MLHDELQPDERGTIPRRGIMLQSDEQMMHNAPTGGAGNQTNDA